MTVHVRFFSGIVPLVGEKAVDLTLPDGTTVAGLKDRLVDRFPQLEGFMSTYVIAVAEEMQSPEHVVRDGDVVDLIPPIAGG
jgi:molybdopterin synthase sulfur carrier subunit